MGATISGDIGGIVSRLKSLGNDSPQFIDKLHRVMQELVNYGLGQAQLYLANAVYDGTPDYHIRINWISPTACTLTTYGDTVAFMEFGTGIVYPDNHPKAPEFGAVRGEYGYKLGRHWTWRYPASHGAGTNAVPDQSHPGYLLTHGNPANKIMYNTGKDMHAKVREILAKEFRLDD